MFIRVRKLSRRSIAFDVVEAARIDGKPRQRILLGLGSMCLNRELEFWISTGAKLAASDLEPSRQNEVTEKLLAHVPCPALPKLMPMVEKNVFHNVAAQMLLDAYDAAGRPALPFGRGQRSEKVEAMLEEIDAWMYGDG
jgi:hypothetical protein